MVAINGIERSTEKTWRDLHDKKTLTYLLFAFSLKPTPPLPFSGRLSQARPKLIHLSETLFLYHAQGFTPILGAVCLLAAGLVSEKLEITK